MWEKLLLASILTVVLSLFFKLSPAQTTKELGWQKQPTFAMSKT